MVTSAGLLMYRIRMEAEFLLAHPGGPYFAKKDEGSWTIPKGLIEPGDEALATAIREFHEETGITANAIYFLPLPDVKYKNGKLLKSWAFEQDLPGNFLPESNTFEIEWPPRSGKMQVFPEIDRVEFFSYADAARKIHPVQLPLLDALKAALNH